ncbi:phage major capsid protein [Anaerosporobacter faecicola]|uniref:phage major capsid protein n=1 Tax=Anaerosporobacter faecicola TaxID=2718714 RepID=UPI0014398C0F|nr:hypothetical protein [Anaerosporobacter faecicola]
MTLEQLKAKKVQLVQQQKQLTTAAKDGKRDLSSEEQTQFDNLQREIDEVDGQIKALLPDTIQPTLEQERTRIAEITQMCRDFGVDDKDLQRYISDGTNQDQVRTAILDKMKADGQPLNQRGIDVTKDSEDKYREAAADALVMRGGVNIEKPSEGARELMGMSLRDLAIEALEKEGEQGLLRMSTDELFGRLTRAYFNPTAAFPAILDTAINKAYVEGHRTAAVTFDKWTKKGTLKDFKTHDNNYLAGPAGEFLEVPEGAEIKHDTPSDEKKPTRKLKTYARQFTMTRQAFINDDIDFLSKIPSKYATAARKTQNKQVYNILINNPVIYDGTKLFTTAHKNVLASGTGITADAVQKMFLALQMQTDEFGDAVIIRPTYFVVPVGYSFAVYEIFNSATINTTSNTQAANPLYRYREMLEVIEDPTLNVLAGTGAIPWFVVGDKSDTDSIEVDYLNGNEIPTIRRMESPGTLGFVWDIYLDWGISVMDYRGIVKNPGTTIASPF